MKGKILLVVAMMIGIAGASGFLFAASGIYNVAASQGHWPITRALLSFAMRRSVKMHAIGIEVPPLDDDEALLGLGHYAEACTPCHGAPGEARSPVTLGAVPEPPLLVEEIADWKPGELFWIVKNGLKYTSMPAWPAQERDDEVWAVVAGLLRLADLGPAEYRRIVRGEPLLQLDQAEENARLIATAGTVGEDLVACARCHGLAGEGRGSFPRLAGQQQAYLYESLRNYQLGVRASGMMQPIASELSDEDMQGLSRYFAAMPQHASANPERPKNDLIQRGEAIARSGLRERAVPACAACHDPTRPLQPLYPRLDGQSRSYLGQQLRLFRYGVRDATPEAQVMMSAAKALSDADIAAVSAYYEQAP